MIFARVPGYEARGKSIIPSLRDLSDFVPEGLDDRSQPIHCLEHVQLRIRPVGHGLIPTQLINRPNRGTPIGSNHTVPTGRVLD